jgi:tartrate dehydrogenase/decarboxylase/D-malate dehydrogenase
MGKYRIAVVPGDGIGIEIAPEGIKVLDAVASQHGFSLNYEIFGWGAGYPRF